MPEPETNGRVMVIVAHPDDAEFAAGGTIARWASEGREVVYVVCTNGDKGSSDLSMTSDKLAPIREREQRNAAAVLGVKEAVFLGYPDGGLEDTPAFREKLVRMIRRYRPDTVLIMDPFRRPIQHRDHRIAGQVALDAVFPYARDHLSYPEHLKEGLMPHKVAEVYIAGAEGADTFVDISSSFCKKVEALRCHVSQVGNRPREEFEQRLREASEALGKTCGLPMAEAFRRLELRR